MDLEHVRRGGSQGTTSFIRSRATTVELKTKQLTALTHQHQGQDEEKRTEDLERCFARRLMEPKRQRHLWICNEHGLRTVNGPTDTLFPAFILADLPGSVVGIFISEPHMVGSAT